MLHVTIMTVTHKVTYVTVTSHGHTIIYYDRKI